MDTAGLRWCQSIPGELISSNEVHVWRVFLDATNIQSESVTGILSADELAKAEKFHFEGDQKKFIMTRGLLRMILGSYLGKKPGELCFEYNAFGKPVLPADAGCDALQFNLSHSGEIALYAVTRGRNIGIDAERIRDNVDIGQIAKRFFSAEEIRSLDSIHKKNRSEVFFKYWTRKEAFIKARGEGISFPMEQCDVSSISGSMLSPVKLPDNSSESLRWYGQDLFPGPGYAAAIAVEGNDCDISCWHYPV